MPNLKPDGSAPDPIDGACVLGGTSHYMVNATTVDDIAKSVRFAARFNLRFRVKNVRDYNLPHVKAREYSLTNRSRPGTVILVARQARALSLSGRII